MKLYKLHFTTKQNVDFNLTISESAWIEFDKAIKMAKPDNMFYFGPGNGLGFYVAQSEIASITIEVIYKEEIEK